MFPPKYGASGSEETVVELIKRMHRSMWKKKCTRCGLRGHERSSCWYLNQMNLEARRLARPADRRRYAMIRKRAGTYGKMASKKVD